MKSLQSAIVELRLGASELRRPGASIHEVGTARMSVDPARGVTNPYGRTHEVPNLFISDGSVFSSAGAANPTLTIVALVLRQADYISRELVAGRL